MVSLGTDGRIASQGTLSKVLDKDKHLAVEIAEERQEAEKAEQTIDDATEQDPAASKSDGKLIVAEEISEGHVGWPARESFGSLRISPADFAAVKLYFASLGGDSPIIFWSLFLGGIFIVNLTQTVQAWYLGYWARQYEISDPSEISAS